MKNKDIKKDFVGKDLLGFCILKGEESFPTLWERVVLYLGGSWGRTQALRKQAWLFRRVGKDRFAFQVEESLTPSPCGQG